MDTDQRERYLGLLGVQADHPTLQGLHALVHAQLNRVPFENLSKLHYLKCNQLRAIPSLDLYLDGIERNNFGGTCYANNYHFQMLLAALGYDVRLCGADMSDPDVHIVCMTDLNGREYLIDVGNAAPFDCPLPRDLDHDYEIVSGPNRYVLKPQDTEGCSRLELYRNGLYSHGYLAKPTARTIEEFETVVLDSFSENSTFMNAILLTRAVEKSFIVIHNLTIIESSGEWYERRKVANRDEMISAIDQLFGIRPEITSDIVHGFVDLRDVWD